MNFLNDLLNTNAKEITGLTRELKSIYIYNKSKENNILFVTSTLEDATKTYNSLSNYTSNVWLFPMDDFLTSEAIAISPEFKVTRLETIDHILNKEKGIIITNLMGYLRYLPPQENFKKAYIKLEKNKDYQRDALIQKLFKIGYKRQTTVNMTGEIAERGFVLDIFPINEENPIRIEFWGDTIDTIKYFDPQTQRTTKEIDKITIYPNTEFLIKEDTFDLKYRQMPEYTKVYSIKDYIDNPLIIFDNKNDLLNNYNLLKEEIENYNISEDLDKNTKYMFDFDQIKPNNQIIFEQFNNKHTNDLLEIKAKEIEPFSQGYKYINQRFNTYLKTNKIIIVCLDNRYQINKLIDDLDNPNLVFTNENNLYPKKINLIIKDISEGFEIDNYIVISPKELFNIQDETKYKTKFKYGTRIKDITKLNIGDYVVHGAYGIGIYKGLKSINKNGVKKDYLTIEYKDQDKLYIPVEKLDLISKYSGKEGSVPKINKLGSKEWAKAKARARHRAEDMAEDLLELYAERETKQGFAFKPDDKYQIQFEKEFPYQETPDQRKVTEQIKKDMESHKPMDRLLCGDVGYGKTEVAFRAIFKCIDSGKQAAILCPTTILSQQHFQNAQNRFKDFPIKIKVLNRFVTSKNLKETLKEIKDGTADLVIGTHRLLSDDVEFKDLGLLVIDEEQRFGVKHKEKIKKYKNNIDVLTLSATPIPRTLQMSMSGIRSLSMIETPPAQRYPIQTYVLAENNEIIKEAISKELARNGQAFVLFNRVENIETKKLELQNLLPTAKIEIAHGRMDKKELEDTMIRFQEHKFDILLCTTIIETGIDIPSVNTLIIIDADRFGLSQLYQIRGRIGRSNKVAYCYLMYNKNKILSEVATKRLNVIKEFTELGSGFAIAMRDLSIRGAGDLLGGEQSGFIDSVGIELFLEMLNEEVQKLQGKQIEEKDEESTKPVVDVQTSIDDKYVQDEDIKIEIHKLINSIDSKERLNEVKQELTDRFGKPTENMIIYMYEELLEKECQKLGIDNIRQTKNFIEIKLPKEKFKDLDGQELFYEITSLGKMFRFKNDNENLIIILDIVNLDKHFVYYMLDLMEIINKVKKGK